MSIAKSPEHAGGHPTEVRLLAEYPGACLAVVDEDLRYQFVSDAKARLVGSEPQHMVGRRAADFFGEDWESERRPLVREAASGSTRVSVIETLRGWRCLTKIFGLEPDSTGRRRAIIMSRPVAWIPGGVRAADAGGRFVEARHNDGDILQNLSGTERDVLRLIGLGLSTDDIASVLQRSRKTIEWHRSSLGKKLGVANRVELAMIAVRAGLCSMFGEAGAGSAAIALLSPLPPGAHVTHGAGNGNGAHIADTNGQTNGEPDFDLGPISAMNARPDPTAALRRAKSPESDKPRRELARGAKPGDKRHSRN